MQGRLYALDVASGKVTRLGGDFDGSWEDLAVTHDGEVVAAGLKGVDTLLYRVEGAKVRGLGVAAGSYGRLDASLHGGAVLFTHSTINEPTQVFVASSVAAMKEAKAVTAFNPIFGERAQVSWRPYRWRSSDGTAVEGVLIYPPKSKNEPPGKKDAKRLRMLTLIHGGPGGCGWRPVWGGLV